VNEEVIGVERAKGAEGDERRVGEELGKYYRQNACGSKRTLIRSTETRLIVPR
jgi:hypothetical protein